MDEDDDFLVDGLSLRLFEEKDRILFSYVDMVVFFFGLWLAFNNVIFGPLIRRWIAKPLWLAEMGCNLFYVMRNR